MKKLLDVLTNIYRHPMNRHDKAGAIARFLRWQIGFRLLGYPIVYPFIEGSTLVMERGMSGATGNLYNGLHEHNEMLFLLHFLKEDDYFVDVGANVGSYSILASYNCKAITISFEPVVETFFKLKRNVLINELTDRVTVYNQAVGKEEGVLTFTKKLDAANHAVSESEETIVGDDTVIVKCTTLDNTLLQPPILMKIDVEGFESEVIAGAQKTLSAGSLQAIIIELNGSGGRYGFNELDIHNKLVGYGFAPCQYNPFTRELSPINHWGTHNTIYVRDIDFVRGRVRSAKKIKVNNLEL